MTDTANVSQFEAWNGDSGQRWVAGADERDRILAPVADVLLAVAAPTPGTRVLDVGCGCGATTLMAATQVGDTGSVTGIDLSAPMLDVARRRARAARADQHHASCTPMRRPTLSSRGPSIWSSAGSAPCSSPTPTLPSATSQRP